MDKELYRIVDIWGEAEEDNYQEGLTDGQSYSYDLDHLEGTTYGFEVNADGQEASERELELFKGGKITLYYLHITMHVEKIPAVEARTPSYDEMTAELKAVCLP